MFAVTCVSYRAGFAARFIEYLMFQKALAVTAWTLLILIAFVTLSPLGLRPGMAGAAFFERFGAYAVLGLAFGMSYPRRVLMVASIVIGAAVALELLQHLTPDRHGRLPDLIAKACGGIFGITIAELIGRCVLARSFGTRSW